MFNGRKTRDAGRGDLASGHVGLSGFRGDWMRREHSSEEMRAHRRSQAYLLTP